MVNGSLITFLALCSQRLMLKKKLNKIKRVEKPEQNKRLVHGLELLNNPPSERHRRGEAGAALPITPSLLLLINQTNEAIAGSCQTLIFLNYLYLLYLVITVV